MEARLLEQNKEKTRASLMFRKVSIPYLNTIRRFMMEEVPVMAVDVVEFKKNSSALYDEIVAHRIGLLPLKTDLKSYALPSKCTCKGEGCARCQLKLTLKGKGPGIVYASDMKSKDPAVKPLYPDMPIVKLLDDQEIELVAIATLGQGKNHAKWSPGLFYYKNKPALTIKKNPSNPEVYSELCPKKIFENKNGSLIINKDKVMSCHLCGACTDLKGSVIELEESQDEFILFMESWGQLSCKEIATKATDFFDEQISEFVEKLKELK
ncbi:DNA-directed RNA polymerase subunit D [Candidatus Woesearchaeota archaeon]|nr:DNA-directed RNA polymerase subunit D [Candidatus Woesearchaeota archaeon]